MGARLSEAMPMTARDRRPAAADPRAASRDFMKRDLARSGLTPRDLNVEPLPVGGWSAVAAYRILYPANPGEATPYYRDRLDRERNKYIGPSDRVGVWFRDELARARWRKSKRKLVVEGEKKAAAAGKYLGLPVCGIGGVSLYQRHGQPLGEIFDHLAPGDVVDFVPDGDVVDPAKDVGRAAARFANWVTARGAAVRLVQLPAEAGLDDWLVPLARQRCGRDELCRRFDVLPSIDPATLPEWRVDAIVRRDLAPLDADLSRIAPGLQRTDLGNAERLVALFHERIKYCVKLGRWLAWDGRRWAVDTKDAVGTMYYAKATVRAIHLEAARAPDAEMRKELAKWAIASEAANRLRAMIDLARSDPKLHVALDALDADPWVLSVRNGTLDLRTRKLLPHDPARLITMLANVTHDPRATCPRWDRFLARILPDRRVRAFVQRAAGYSLSGDTMEKMLIILFGTGDNGKTTMVETLQAMFGDYAHKTPVETFRRDPRRSGNAPSPERMALRGKRFVVSSEFSGAMRLDDSLLKDLTGGDRMGGRGLYGDMEEFLPACHLWFYCNEKPAMRGDDAALWTRPKLVPFEVQIPIAEQVKDLGATLVRDERSGILNWALAGLRAHRRGGMRPPESVLAATAAYRNDQDTLGQFITEACTTERRGGQRRGETLPLMFKGYEQWAHHAGIRLPLTRRTFQSQLTQRGFPTTPGGANQRITVGLWLQRDPVIVSG